MIKEKHKKIVFIRFLILIIFVPLFFSYMYLIGGIVTEIKGRKIVLEQAKKGIYLSDLDYITENNWSYNGWNGHSIQIDKNQDGGSLSLITNGEKVTYVKGIGIHARGQITYDVSEYSINYPRFIAKLGVDASRGTGGSIWFKIFTSNDGEVWNEILPQTETLTGISNAIDVDLNIEGVKYLRIFVDPDGNNTADHGTIASAKLVALDYSSNDDIYYNKVHKLEYYDDILKDHDVEYNYQNNIRIVLERELVNKLGYYNIQNSAEFTLHATETLDWILENNRVLENVIEVGEIGNVPKFLEVLANLYRTYKSDLETENGYVYEKMMIALAAGYATDRISTTLAFNSPPMNYDYMERFRIFKQLFDEGFNFSPQ